MTIFYYFIITHLLGDFTFQTGKIVALKNKLSKGTKIHVLVHFFIGILLFLPLILIGYYELLISVLFISILHYLIDQAKIKYSKHHSPKLVPFLIDQLFHLIVLFLAFIPFMGSSLNLPDNSFYNFYTWTPFLIYWIGVLFSAKVTDIIVFHLELEKNSKLSFKPILKKTFVRALIFSALYWMIYLLLF